jgi:hypothetical protein
VQHVIQTILKARSTVAENRLLSAARRLHLALRYNPNWHLQPRVPAGNSDGGQWVAYLTSASSSLLPVLQRIGPAAIAKVRNAARQLAPALRRLPSWWGDDSTFPAEENFDAETRRISQDSWQRHGYPTIRFRSEEELRRYLGPAGEGREWHHIVEKRLAGRDGFPVEMIHSTDNIINLPIEVHRRVSAKMSMRSVEFAGDIRRFWVEKLPFGDQYNHGLRLIEETLEYFGNDPARF